MSLVLLPRQIVIDQNGKPRVGAKLYVFDASTNNPRVSYTTPAYGIPHTNPVLSVGNGYFPAVYVNPTGGDYKIVITDALDATLYTEDNLPVRDRDFDATAMGLVLNPRTQAESEAGITPTNYSYQSGNVLRYGADPSGLTDSTIALQVAINAGWAYAGSAPNDGINRANPVIEFPPGRYRISNTLVVPTGMTLRGTGHPSHTTNHTRIIMDSTATNAPNGAGDNRNKPIFKFNRLTLTGGILMNTACTSSIENLEFWYVTPDGTFNQPLSTGISFGDYPLGGTLFFDVDAADFYVVNCVFQHAPAAIRIKDVPNTVTTRGDGTSGNRGVGVIVQDCEFDASTSSHIYATGSHVNLLYKNCYFFNARHHYESCTGTINYQNCQFRVDVWIDAGTSNTLDEFTHVGCVCDNASSFDHIFLNKATKVTIRGEFMGASGKSCIVVTDADAGSIGPCTVDSSGFNTPPGTGIDDYVAAIKLRGCRNLLVNGNNITASAAGIYNGFGILSADSASRTSQYNYFNGNAITAPYGGATYNNQGRHFNIMATDLRGVNYNQQSETTVQEMGSTLCLARFSLNRISPTYGATVTIETGLGNQFAINATNGTAFTISTPTALGTTPGQRITIQVINLHSGALGTITWGAGYKMAAWTSPANGFSRSIDFQFDGTVWREVSRTPADVPN
jgi:hypothetical protein